MRQAFIFMLDSRVFFFFKYYYSIATMAGIFLNLLSAFGNLFVLFVLLKFLFFNIQGLFFMFNFFQLIEWKLEQIGMNPTAETYLCLHRFGSVSILSYRYFCVCINNRLGQYVWLPSWMLCVCGCVCMGVCMCVRVYIHTCIPVCRCVHVSV